MRSTSSGRGQSGRFNPAGLQKTLQAEVLPRVALFGSMLLVTGLIVGLV